MVDAERKTKLEKVEAKGKHEMDQVLAPSTYRLTDEAYAVLFFRFLEDIKEDLEVLRENADAVKAAQAMGGVVSNKTTQSNAEGNFGKPYSYDNTQRVTYNQVNVEKNNPANKRYLFKDCHNSEPHWTRQCHFIQPQLDPNVFHNLDKSCLLYTSPSPRD